MPPVTVISIEPSSALLQEIWTTVSEIFIAEGSFIVADPDAVVLFASVTITL